MTPIKLTFLLLLLPISLIASEAEAPRPINYPVYPSAPERQSQQTADLKSFGCVTCHTATDAKSMHVSPSVILGCTDCHGGDSTIIENDDSALGRAHVSPRFPDTWQYPSSANPKRSYTLLNHESPEFIRFVNPSDYRVAEQACGACHQKIIDSNIRSMMATGVMLFGGAAYNNGILPFKNYILGEGYTADGEPAKITGSDLDPTVARQHGVIPELYALPVWETDPLRCFDGVRERTEQQHRESPALAALRISGATEWGCSQRLAQGARAIESRAPVSLRIVNVPGPQVPLYLQGARLTECYGKVPLGEHGGLGVAVFSYDGNLCWGLNADFDLMPDLPRFTEAVRESFDALSTAAARKASPLSVVGAS